MKKRKIRRFAYVVDIHDSGGGWGVMGLKEFENPQQALDYAQNLADTNRQVDVSLQIIPQDRSTVPRNR
jgi:hypothetical protein